MVLYSLACAWLLVYRAKRIVLFWLDCFKPRSQAAKQLALLGLVASFRQKWDVKVGLLQFGVGLDPIVLQGRTPWFASSPKLQATFFKYLLKNPGQICAQFRISAQFWCKIGSRNGAQLGDHFWGQPINFIKGGPKKRSQKGHQKVAPEMVQKCRKPDCQAALGGHFSSNFSGARLLMRFSFGCSGAKLITVCTTKRYPLW